MGPDASRGPRRLRGSCVCGGLIYEVTDAFAYALNCHCSQCRRTTGSAFKPFAGIAIEEVSLLQGADTAMRRGDEVEHDLFCSRCGSLVYSVVREGHYAHVTLGTLANTPSIRPSAHIFVGSKAEWFTITDDLPQHHELP